MTRTITPKIAAQHFAVGQEDKVAALTAMAEEALQSGAWARVQRGSE